MKRIAIGCLVALGLVVAGATAANAGEYNGKGERLETGAHVANSACAFSGRDLPDGSGPGQENNPFPFMDDDDYTGGHVQSYGQYVRAGDKALFPSPGVACRGGAELGE
jgi:hypothetical protein